MYDANRISVKFSCHPYSFGGAVTAISFFFKFKVLILTIGSNLARIEEQRVFANQRSTFALWFEGQRSIFALSTLVARLVSSTMYIIKDWTNESFNNNSVANRPYLSVFLRKNEVLSAVRISIEYPANDHVYERLLIPS